MASNGKWVNPLYSQMADVAVRTAFDSLTSYLGGWQDFSTMLSWTSSGTQPSLGNGTKEAQYRLVGDICFYEGAIFFGSTTSPGTGQYGISLPFPAHTTTTNNTPWIGAAKHYNGAGVDKPAVMQIYAGTVVNFAVASDGVSTAQNWSNTWAGAPNGGNMCWTIWYRIKV